MDQDPNPTPPQFTATSASCVRDIHDFQLNPPLMACRRCGMSFMFGQDAQWHMVTFGKPGHIMAQEALEAAKSAQARAQLTEGINTVRKMTSVRGNHA